jgi:hypothetical protein
MRRAIVDAIMETAGPETPLRNMETFPAQEEATTMQSNLN